MNQMFAFFTFNMGGTHANDWASILTNEDWNFLKGKKEDNTIYVICTQEDGRYVQPEDKDKDTVKLLNPAPIHMKSKFIEALKHYFQNYTCHECPQEYCMITEILKTHPFYVHLAVFVPNNVTNHMKDSDTVIYHSVSKAQNGMIVEVENPLYEDNTSNTCSKDPRIIDKGIIKAYFKNVFQCKKVLPFLKDQLSSFQKTLAYKRSLIINININNVRYVFVGSHFPFNPKDEKDTSGREAALNEVMTYYHGIPENKIMFLLGDLNFRRPDGNDQLTQLLNIKKSNHGEHKIYNVVAEKEVSYTCATQKKDSYDTCSGIFNKRTNEYNTECYILNKKGIVRTPSNCDRVVLFSNMEYSVVNSDAEAIFVSPINKSDHNAVFATLEIKIGENGGYKKKEYILLKENKRQYLVRKEGKKKYILRNKEKVYLGNIRGRYDFANQSFQ